MARENALAGPADLTLVGLGMATVLPFNEGVHTLGPCASSWCGHEDYGYGRLRAVALLRRREFCQRGKVDVDLGLQMTGSERGTAVGKLRRWQASGGIWRVMSCTSSGLTVARLACDADEEVDTLTCEDAEVLDYIGGLSTSEDSPREPVGPGSRR